MKNKINIPQTPIEVLNLNKGEWVKGKGEAFSVESPYTGQIVGRSYAATGEDVAVAVKNAHDASLGWRKTPLKERTRIMFRFREILMRNVEEIAQVISLESGKTLGESRAGIMKGVEVLEFALSLQNLDKMGRMEVSRGVFCEYRREPLGVVAAITPFNFPAMVPMWMLPIAITLGNSFVWKPSDKTPLTSEWIGRAATEAGVPPGVLTIIQGGVPTVEALLENPQISAIGFVGSTPVARTIYEKGTAQGKRVLALGGAKNHIFLLPDADEEMTGQGITDSFSGCAGQRCMAASVLLAVGKVDHLINRVVERSQSKTLGEDMGALITKASYENLCGAIEEAEKAGVKVLLDGRQAKPPKEYEGGYWLGLTILDQVPAGSRWATEELFGPVLSIIRCKDLDEALSIENENPYGNAASVFTRDGGAAEKVIQNAKAGMTGVNIGVPVPREPFSFGGFYDSKFGMGEITGEGSLALWSDLKKVTTKWEQPQDLNWMS